MNVLITGAAGGMGQAATEILSKNGHAVWGLDCRKPERTDGWTFVKTDLTSEEAVREAFETIAEKNIKIDALIHHAGIYDLNSLLEMEEAEVQRIFDVNLLSIVRVNRIFLPLLSGGAKIVITSSELAPLDPLPFTGIYAVTKAAVEKYAYSLRMEAQLLGHRVSVIRPGAVSTGLLKVSMKRLDAFCKNTKLYPCNAARFRKIVNAVEARSVSPEKIAALDLKILNKKNPKYVYTINRNPGLLLLNALPDRLQNFIIRKILKP